MVGPHDPDHTLCVVSIIILLEGDICRVSILSTSETSSEG